MAAQCVGLLLWIIGSVAAGDVPVKAKPGETITLQCNSSTGAAVTNFVWTRTDLKDDYVFFFRDNRANENYQDPSFHGRVALKDPEMKNGDVSVVLKNVTVNDTGTYKCQVIPSMNRRKRNVGELGTLVNSVHLMVSKGPEKEINDEQPGGSRGYIWLGVVCLGVVVVVVGLVVKSKRANVKRPSESVDEQEMCEMNP